MTFDTFDTYNTDEAYKDKGTTAKGLVAAYKKDNPNGTAEDFYSKLNKTWAQDKDGYVKKAVDDAFTVETPKEEKKEKVKETVKTETPKANTTTSNISKADKNFMESQFAITDEAKRKAINDAINEKAAAFNNTLDTLEKQGAAYKTIDDHYLEGLPTFAAHRFFNGEFGSPESKDAKIRLAYFMINGLQSKLKNAANVASVVAGKGQIFSDTTSDYEKLQQSNLANGLENRWNKYKTETNNAMSMLQNRGYKEEELTDAARTIAENQNLQTAFNMVDENKKAYILEVVTKLGNKIGNMNDKSFVDLMLGMASSGTVDPAQAAEMIGIRAGGSLASKYNLFDDNGNLDLTVVKNLIGSLGKDATGGILKDYGIDIDSIDFSAAGIGGAGGESGDTGDTPATGVKLSDGTVLDPGKWMSINDYSEINKVADKLSNKYYRGEISEEEFRDDYNKLYNVVQQHNIMNKITGTLKPVDARVKELKGDRIDYWNRQIDDLNKQAKNGLIKPSDYEAKFAEYEKSLVNAGGDAKKTAKKKISNEDIIKAIEKIEKVKSKKK